MHRPHGLFPCHCHRGWLLASFGHDQQGRRTSIGRPSGANTNYVYDNAGRLASLGHDFPDNSYDLTLSYTHNPAGQIASRTSSNPGSSPGQAHVYSYGAVSNGAASSTVNGLNQVTNTGGTAVTHDGNGNVNAIGSEGYGYTAENMLAVGGGYYFQLDPLGRPRLIHKPDWSAARAVTYDGEKTILEHGAQGISRRYAHGSGTDEPLVEYIGPETSFRRWLYTDERGSVIARANEHGTIEAVNRYDEYGTPASTNLGTFQYTGQKWVPELGMYDYKARVYNPTLGGRFMQPDPIGYGDGMNVYAAMSGDPINRRDPSGTCSINDPRPCHEDSPVEVCGGTRDRSGRCVNPQSALDRSFLLSLTPGQKLEFGLPMGCSWIILPGRAGSCSLDPWEPTLPPQDPNPDQRRDACGNPYPPASRRYSVPPGMSGGRDPQNRFVVDSGGQLVMNPYYETAFRAGGGPDVGAIRGDLIMIGGIVVAGQIARVAITKYLSSGGASAGAAAAGAGAAGAAEGILGGLGATVGITSCQR